MSHSNQKPFDRMLLNGALGVLLGAVLLGLAQCTMVGDPLTGVDLSARSAPVPCLRDCRRDYHDAVFAERRHHLEAQERCRDLKGHERKACRDTEDALFEQRLAVLKAQFDECRNGCHRQGSGSAG